MTIGHLKKLIADANLPDTAPVLLSGSDHSYYTVGHIETEAVEWGRRDFAEYYGEEYLQPGERKIQALILR